jgi:carboxyl-terminal processing protease
MKSGEKYLDYSLPWGQIESVKYNPFSSEPIDLDMIRQRSLQRGEHDPGLQLIAEEAAKADERSKQTTISLRLADMRQKIEEVREGRKKIQCPVPKPPTRAI